MKTIILILSIAISSLGYSQNEKTEFHAHQNLIGGIWKSSKAATWDDGTPFKLFITYEESLDGKIIKTKTYGNISEQGYEFGLRNEGIISYNKQENIKKFHEFDIFGGLTSGELKYHIKDIYYTYKYPLEAEDLILTDYLEFIDKDTYDFTVGVYDDVNNRWKKKFLTTQFKRSKNEGDSRNP